MSTNGLYSSLGAGGAVTSAAITSALGYTPQRVALASSGTAVNIDNSAAETTIHTATIPAGVMGTNGLIRTVIDGSCLNNTGGTTNTTLRIRATFGSTLVFDGITSATSLTSNASRRGVSIVLDIWNNNSASSQSTQGMLFVGPTSGFTGNNPIHAVQIGTDSTEDTTSSKTLTVTMTLGTNSTELEYLKKHSSTVLINT